LREYFTPACWIAALLAARVCDAAPVDLWPAQAQALDAASLNGSISRIDAASDGLPAELRPAADFEKVFLRIISGLPQAAWLPDARKFARLEGPVGDVARTWLARVEMEEIDAALREYYAENVRFPDSLEEAKLPDGLRMDPWGEKWVYRLSSPQGFSGMNGQRYELGPGRFPRLAALKEAIQGRRLAQPPLHPDWKIAERDIAGKKALEFRRGDAALPVATLEEGGKVEDCTLLFIGENWVLMAGADQLFALPF